MAVSTLVVSACFLWGLVGFILGVSSFVTLGVCINKKNQRKANNTNK